MAANFTLFFAFYLLTPLLPLYLAGEPFGAGKDVIGLVLSGYTFAVLLSRPFSGYLVDSFPRKRVLMVFFFLFFVFFGFYISATSLLIFALVRTLHGLPFGALTVANSTVAIDVLPSSRRNEGIGYYGLGNNLAMALAPSFGLLVYQRTGSFELLFWLALFIAGVGMAVDATLRLEPRTPVGGRRKLSLDRFFLVRGWLIAANMVCFGLCFGLLSNYLALYTTQTLPASADTGMFFMLCSVGLIASRLWGSKALRKGLLTHNATEGVVLSSLGYVAFIAVPNAIGYYSAAILIGLGNGHIWPAFQNMIIQTARHDQRGTANSTLLVSWDAGMGLGILVGGLLSEHLGYAATFWAAAVVQVAGTVLFMARTGRFFKARRLAQ